MTSDLASRLDRAMTPEQFNQVVSAILDGKYSWACLLILQFAGYNPLHYIPYRTYNRLMKENTNAGRSRRSQPGEPIAESPCPETESLSLQDCLSRLEDLGYLEPLEQEPSSVRGGGGRVRLENYLFFSSLLD